MYTSHESLNPRTNGTGLAQESYPFTEINLQVVLMSIYSLPEPT